jgi:subtilisin family serine protease
MKKHYAVALLLLAVQSCRDRQEQTPQANSATQTPAELDAFIWQNIRTKGEFKWSMASNEQVSNALRWSDGVMSVGFKPANQNADIRDIIHTIDINSGTWQQAGQQVLDLIYASEREVDPTLTRANLIAFEETVLPVLDVRVKNPATVTRLRASNLVRYAEPMGYQPGQNDPKARPMSDSGCGSNTPETGLVAGADYTTLAPDSKSSWHHPFHNVQNAWAQSTGAGQKLMIIDTGISPMQNNFGTAFNQGNSSGRTIEKRVTLPKAWPWSAAETPDDGCGHGTSMAGAAAAPRGTDGAPAGIAYNANLVTCRAAVDVVISESREYKGVADAYVLAAGRGDIKIISMSMGSITSSSQVGDAVRLAYNNGKLIFCAAGTSFGWSAGWYGVIFPANMSEVQAVTGVKDNLTQRCEVCHVGSQVDFVVVMEKASNGRKPLSLAQSGDVPSTVGGSSVATASTAGMAALVWAKNPGLSRDQVVARMAAAANYYPNRNSDFGWGRVNLVNAL